MAKNTNIQKSEAVTVKRVQSVPKTRPNAGTYDETVKEFDPLL
jgi:hypothetical protein